MPLSHNIASREHRFLIRRGTLAVVTACLLVLAFRRHPVFRMEAIVRVCCQKRCHSRHYAAPPAAATAASRKPVTRSAAAALQVLKNSLGTEVHVLPRGATLQRILLADAAGGGGKVDVVLGFDSEAPYQVGGWVAGRLPWALGRSYQPALSAPSNVSPGPGRASLSSRRWAAGCRTGRPLTWAPSWDALPTASPAHSLSWTARRTSWPPTTAPTACMAARWDTTRCCGRRSGWRAASKARRFASPTPAPTARRASPAACGSPSLTGSPPPMS